MTSVCKSSEIKFLFPAVQQERQIWTFNTSYIIFLLLLFSPQLWTFREFLPVIVCMSRAVNCSRGKVECTYTHTRTVWSRLQSKACDIYREFNVCCGGTSGWWISTNSCNTPDLCCLITSSTRSPFDPCLLRPLRVGRRTPAASRGDYASHLLVQAKRTLSSWRCLLYLRRRLSAGANNNINTGSLGKRILASRKYRYEE